MKKNGFLLSITGFLAFVLIEACESSKASTSKLFAFNFEKGKGYNYEMVWDMTQGIMGKEMKSNITANYSMDVKADDGKVKTIEVMYNDFKMNMDMMGKAIIVDSEQPSENIDPDAMKTKPAEAMKKLFGGIKGKTFSLKVSKEGEVLEVIGFDKIMKSMVDSMGMDEEQKGEMMRMLGETFNDKEIMKQFAQVLYIFPVKEVKVGDTWEKKFETGSMMPLKYNTTFKVKDIEGNHVTLSSRTEILSEMPGLNIKGEQTGTLLVDSRTGLVINADFDQEIGSGIKGMSLTIKGMGKIRGTAR